MNILNALKNYNKNNGELKRLTFKVKEIDLKLENWDKLKAATISDMPIHHDTENGDKIGDNLCKREELQQQRLLLEVRIAELNSMLIEVDSRLDCLQDNFKFILEKQFKENVKFSRIVKMYNDRFGIAEYNTVRGHRSKAKELLNNMR